MTGEEKEKKKNEKKKKKWREMKGEDINIE